MDGQLVAALSGDPLLAERYEVVEVLGAGGMGWVVKARDRTLENETVAIKLLYPHLVEDQQSFARFRNEVLVARKLVHPCIVRTYSFFTSSKHGGYIVMECVEGRTLAQMLTEYDSGLPFVEVTRILYFLATGLRYAHQQGIIHRDLKPGNILVRHDGNIKLSDFGLAQVLRQRSEISTPGMLVGSPYYMAPEQFCSQSLDERTDIYAFGILAYEMITGHVPFDDLSIFALAEKHLTLPLPPDQTLSASPLWFRELLLRCTAKAKEERLQSMHEVAAVLAGQVAESAEEPGGSTVVTSQLRVYNRERRLIRFYKNRRVRISIVLCTFFILLFIARTNPASRQRVAVPILYAGRALGSDFAWLRWILHITVTPETQITDGMPRTQSWSLLRSGSDPDPPGQYPLQITIQSGSFKSTREFLRFGADPNRRRPPELEAPLHLLTGEMGASLTGDLIEAGAEVNIRDIRKATPLLFAVRRHDTAMIKALLTYHADPELADNLGRTPLAEAVQDSQIAIIRMLLEAGAKTGGAELAGPLGSLPKETRAQIREMLAGPEK